MNFDPDLSFCIVSYQTCDLLRECLNSLLASSHEMSFEVIVVDNHSADGTIEMLRTEFPDVKLIEEESNLGYTRPMNRALRAARAKKYLIQLNPDTIILPETFTSLAQFMDANPKVGICTPKILSRDGSLQKQCRRSAARPWDAFAYFFRLARLFPHSRRFNGYLMGYLGEDEISPVEAVSGSCMFIRKEVISQIGYLDEKFFAYQEDSDFCFRARQAGWQIYYVPLGKVIHYGGLGGSQRELRRSIIEWHRSYYYYYRKNLARDYFFVFNWLFYLLMLLKLGLSLLSINLTQRNYVGSPK